MGNNNETLKINHSHIEQLKKLQQINDENDLVSQETKEDQGVTYH